MMVANGNTYLLNNSTGEVVNIVNFTIENDSNLINIEIAKDLTTLQNPTEWDIIKKQAIRTTDNFNVMSDVSVIDGVHTIYWNVRELFYNYLLTLPEYSSFVKQSL
jgi:hypothetical protein